MSDKSVNLKEREKEKEIRNAVHLLTFLQGGELYGIRIDKVLEVIDTVNVTHIPLVPTYIRGVINLRGNVLPVIDLSARFGGDPATIGKFTSVIVLELEDKDDVIKIGLMIDAVKEVLVFSEDDIDDTPDFGTRIRTDFISGVGKQNGNFIIILNLNTVLDLEELSAFTNNQLK